jgi:hypothetical protein
MKQKIRLVTRVSLIMVVLSVAASGCTFGVVTKEDPAAVKLGMEKAEVVKLLGKPHSMSASNNVEVLRYNIAHSKAMPIAGGWEEYAFQFVDGKLASYGTTK